MRSCWRCGEGVSVGRTSPRRLEFRHQGMARGDQGSFLPKFEKEETRFLAASGDVFCLGPSLLAWRPVCAVLPASDGSYSDYGGTTTPCESRTPRPTCLASPCLASPTPHSQLEQAHVRTLPPGVCSLLNTSAAADPL